MEILRLKEENRQAAIEKSVNVLRNGGLLIYPTETCYGLGADATSKQAIDLLLSYKREREGKPISIAVADQEMAEKYVELNALAKNLYRQYLPGPLTVISSSRGLIDSRAESATKTLGVRIPDYPMIREISAGLGKPITSTSANTSGGGEPYNIQDLLAGLPEEKKNLLTLLLDAGELPRRPSSTVVDTTSGQLVILRAGALDLRDFTCF
ncbi:MAG: L-threonylcarbamoyladenylate synthase [bacterium]|nr:L-threonylcarbamoyladenylate synthase [bacterium]